MGLDATITREHSIIKDASHIVLPGVGAFKDCMANLERYKLITPLFDAIEAGKPFLGICLGLQVLFEKSEEFGSHKGLGIIKGRVVRFPSDMTSADNNEALKIPHMGWNSIKKVVPHPILDGIPDGTHLYFVHSYYVVPEDDGVVVTKTDYGIEFVSSISYRNIFACQFHPEKSQRMGLKILKNFGEI